MLKSVVALGTDWISNLISKLTCILFQFLFEA